MPEKLYGRRTLRQHREAWRLWMTAERHLTPQESDDVDQLFMAVGAIIDALIACDAKEKGPE